MSLARAAALFVLALPLIDCSSSTAPASASGTHPDGVLAPRVDGVTGRPFGIRVSSQGLVLVTQQSTNSVQGFALSLSAPLLPPVPADCLDKGAGTAIVNRNLVGRAETFPYGTHRIYAWFAVSLPARYSQEILFQWYHDGSAVGGPTATTIEGGRAAGWRTSTSKTAPAPGRLRVDVLNEAGQLIGRVRFEVTP